MLICIPKFTACDSPKKNYMRVLNNPLNFLEFIKE